MANACRSGSSFNFVRSKYSGQIVAALFSSELQLRIKQILLRYHVAFAVKDHCHRNSNGRRLQRIVADIRVNGITAVAVYFKHTVFNELFAVVSAQKSGE